MEETVTSIAQIVYQILTCTVFILFVVAALKKGRDAVHVAEVNVRTIASIMLIVSTLIASLALGINIIIDLASNALSISVISLVIGIYVALVFLTLPAIAVYAYLTIPSRFIKELRCYRSIKNGLMQELERLTYSLCLLLGLSKKPQILITDLPGTAPITFGRSRKSAYLVIPRHLDRMTNDVSNSSGIDARTLKEFIIMHELSHIRNGDMPLMSWRSIFMKPLAWWTLFSIGAFVLAMVNSKSIGLFLPFIWLGLAISYLTLISISRHREYLADARASITLPSSAIIGLTRNQNISSPFLSWIESLTAWLSIDALRLSSFRSMKLKAPLSYQTKRLSCLYSLNSYWIDVKKLCNRAFSSFSWRAEKSYVWRYCTSTHPSVSDRNSALRKSKFINEDVPLPSFESSIYSGAVTILLVLLLYTALLNLGRSGGLIMGFTDEEIKATGIYDTLFNIAALAIFFSGMVFLLHLRNSVTPIYRLPVIHYLREFFLRYLLVSVTFVLFSSILLFIVPISSWGNLAQLLLLVFPFYLILFGWFALISKIQQEWTFEQHEFNAFKMCVTLTLWVAIAGPIVFLLLQTIDADITSKTSILILLSSILFSFVPYVVFRAKLIRTVDSISRLLFTYVKRSLPFMNAAALYGYVRIAVFTITDTARFLIPFGIACIIISNIFKLYGLDNTAIDQTLFWSIIAVFGILFLLLIFRWMGISSSHSVANSPTLLYSFVNMLHLLGKNAPQAIKAKLTHVVDEFRGEDGGFKSAPENARSSLQSTYAAVRVYKLSDRALQDEANLIAYVQSHEKPEGGFSVLPETRPELSATYWALNTIYELHLRITNLEAHKKWLFAHQGLYGGFSKTNNKKPTLQDTFYTLGSLRVLNALDDIDREATGSWILEQWMKGPKSFDDTYYCVKSLEILSMLIAETATVINKMWVEPLFPAIVNLRPERNLDHLEKYVENYMATYPQGQEHIQQQLFRIRDQIMAVLNNM